MTRRLPTLVLLAALVAVALVADPRSGGDDGDAAAAAGAQLAPMASSDEAGASTWFCAAGTATAGGGADHVVVFANPTDHDATGTVTVFGEGQPPLAFPAVVPARSREAVVLSRLVDAAHAAALVELDRGGVVVEQEVLGPSGWDASRCASQASASWYLPWGRTAVGSTMRLALFNPFPADAVVDITFDTDEGARVPEALNPLLVPARRLVVVDVGAIVTGRARVSTFVTARTGRLVVSGLQSVEGTDGTVALDLTPAAPAPALVWHFGEGRVALDVSQRIAVLNPSDRMAEVEVAPRRPLAGDAIEIEPFQLRVPAGGYAEIVLEEESRVPLPLRHTTTVRSLNGVPVVAERVTATGTVAAALAGTEASGEAAEEAADGDAPVGDPDAVDTVDENAESPAPSGPAPLPSGLSASIGSPVVAHRWVAASGGRMDAPDAKLVVVNPSPTATVALSVSAFAAGTAVPVDAPSAIEPRRRVDIELILPEGVPSFLVVVDADAPVVVERVQPNLAVGDLTVEPAVPLPGGVEVPGALD